MKWYKVLAGPVAAVYGTAVMVRNALYKAHVLRSHTVGVPTICVGNLAVGGTGKTPFVEYLLGMLSRQYKVAVLSRGYKRKTRGFVLADAETTAREIGDEPMQIHGKFPKVPVAVCEKRVEGVKQLMKRYPDLQVVVLDDAYQHRKIRCGFYILLTAYDRLYIDDHFLPMGRLRDSKHESLRASAVVVTKCPETMRPIDQRIVDTKLHLPTFQQLCFARTVYGKMPEGKKVLVVTGIAHPEYLVEEVKKRNITAGLMAFADHHGFTARDIEKIAKEAARYDVVVTTEKDHVRLDMVALPEEVKEKLMVVGITMAISNEEDLKRQVCQYINENLHPKK